MEGNQMALKKGIYRINGIERTVIADENESMSDVLRRIGLTGVKVGCGTGMCGACTVIVNGEPVRSCVKKWKNVEEFTEITTIEGIGTAASPHPLQLSWVKHGAIQCGFCTPGFILSAKALLDQNPSPAREEVRDWFTKNKNLCRCTGYKQLVDAVMEAAEVLRGEKDIKCLKTGNGDIYDKTYHGRYPRPTALGKALGIVDYGRDVSQKMPEGTLRVAVTWPEYPHALIKSIDTSVAETMPGVERVITAADIRGTNDLGAFTSHRRTKIKNSKVIVLAEGKVRRLGDPIALVAADTEEHARAAAARVAVTYEVLPEYKNALEASAKGTVSINGDDTPNVFFGAPLFKGEDTEKYFLMAEDPDSDYVKVEASFKTTPEPHLALEPIHVQSYFDEEGMLTIHYKDQTPHTNVGRIAGALGLPKEKVRIVMNPSGSAFGYAMIPNASAMTGLVTLLTGRPASMDLTYAETQKFTGKRAPAYFNAGLVANKKTGKLEAMQMHCLLDLGSQIWKGPDLALKLTSFEGVHYQIPNLKGLFSTGLSNRAFCVQYRGYGAPQIYTANESLIDMMAEKLRLDPFEFRLLNIVQPGDTQPHEWPYNVYPHEKLLEIIRPYYEEAKAWKKEPVSGKKRGVGLAFGGYHVSYPGGEHSDIEFRLEKDGTVTFLNGWPDMGQCADVGAFGIACHALEPLGFTPDQIRLYMNDTKKVPDTGMAAGSRSHFVVTNACEDGAKKLAAILFREDGSRRTYEEIVAEGLPVTVTGQYREANTVPWSEDDGHGKLPLEMNYSLYMMTVEVDEKTGKTEVIKVVAAADNGVVGNYNSLDGQAFGGIMHSIGFALREDYNEHGKKYETILGCGFSECKDVPDDMTVIYYEENPREKSPYGASGASEGFQSGAHAAVLNAIADATGVRIYELPATPEKVLAGMQGTAEAKDPYDWGEDFSNELERIRRNPVMDEKKSGYDVDSI